MIARIATLLAVVSASILAGFCRILARRAQAGRKRRLRLLEMELRLADASEVFHREVFSLKAPAGTTTQHPKGKGQINSLNKPEFAAIYEGAPEMKIDERKALNTQKPQSEKVYETKSGVSSRTAQQSSTVGEDGVALAGQDQLRALAMTPSAEEASRVASLTKLVQSGQYQVDTSELSRAMVAALLKGY